VDSQLAAVDLVIVALYVLGLVLLGAWFSRRQGGLASYFVGDRSVSWWLVLASIVATETSTVTFLSIPGVAFNPMGGNLTFLQLALGFALGRLLIAWLLLPQYLRGEVLSVYQLLRQRFDVRVQRTASSLFLLTRTVADGLRLYLTALLLQQMTGWNGVTSVLVLGAITLLYTYLGGIQAIIWTDLIQLIVYLLGALLAGGFILHLSPGGWTSLASVAQADGKLVWLDTALDPRRPYTLWTGLIGGAFFTMASHGADQMMVQRFLCSRSLGQARLALCLSGLVVLVQFLLFLLVGVGLYALSRQGVLVLPEGIRNDQVFGHFIVGHLPAGVIGLVLAAVLSVAMSTLSSSLNSSANALVADFYRPLRPGQTEGHYLRVSRLATLGWGVARMLVAVAAFGVQAQSSVVDQVFIVAGFTTGMVLGLFLLGSLRRRVRPAAALAGLVAGFVAVCFVWRPILGLEAGPLLAWPWYAPVGSLTTVLVALAVDWLGARHGPPGDGSTQPGIHAAR
jgi:SSS family transporter